MDGEDGSLSGPEPEEFNQLFGVVEENRSVHCWNRLTVNQKKVNIIFNR
jgi:hypothetical protein